MHDIDLSCGAKVLSANVNLGQFSPTIAKLGSILDKSLLEVCCSGEIDTSMSHRECLKVACQALGRFLVGC